MRHQACMARARDRMWRCCAMHDANGAGYPMHHAPSSASSSGADNGACKRARIAACVRCAAAARPLSLLSLPCWRMWLLKLGKEAPRQRHRAYLGTCDVTGGLECVRWCVPSSAAGARAGVAQAVAGGAVLVEQQAAGSSYGGQLCLRRRCKPRITRLLAARIDMEAGIGVEVGGGRGGLRGADGGL